MKIILLCYHKNLYNIYKKEWVDQYRESILNQTFKDFEIMEQNYGGTRERIFEHSKFESKEMPTFIHALNHLINKAVYFGADVICNTNADDVYSYKWLEVQLPYMAQGYDLVSCNFSLMRDDMIYHEHHFENLNIKEELNKNHNIICHPTVTYSRNFLENNRYVPEQQPFEDMMLWQRTIDNYKFKIVKENLLLHRIHSNSVCQSNNR